MSYCDANTSRVHISVVAERVATQNPVLGTFISKSWGNERLVYGWRKIMENITRGYGHHE